VFVLVLLGFVATAWIITITLSAADATAHIVENPLVPAFFHDQDVAITLVLLAVLGAVFLKGFKEAIGIAVFVVGAFLLANLVVVGVGFYEIATNPQVLADWHRRCPTPSPPSCCTCETRPERSRTATSAGRKATRWFT
jgi:hypothetical protein